MRTRYLHARDNGLGKGRVLVDATEYLENEWNRTHQPPLLVAINMVIFYLCRYQVQLHAGASVAAAR